MVVENPQDPGNADAIFAGRIDILYGLGRHYLSLPFAALCLPAAMIAGRPSTAAWLMPLALQITVVIAAEQLTTAYRNRPPGSDARYWAHRYTFVSAIAGASWGVATLFWFVWNSFPAQAYLCMAFLGMTATEFIARSAHRPAYIAHTVFALGPLVILLLIQGGLYADLTALLVVLFACVLASYSNSMARLLNETIHLRDKNDDLVRRLEREKADALAARDAAETSAHVKTAFIANISHELRTPLNALLGMAQLLDRAALPSKQGDHVKVMLQAGQGFQTLIDDVIALTRDDEDQLTDEDCDPAQTARVVVRTLQPRAWEKRLHLTLSAAPNLPRVAADPRKVRQVLLKLIDNALKFTQRGLVDIRLESEADGQAVRFTVTDTGHGVNPKTAPLLFKPFSPGDTSYTRRDQGAGLGLAVAKRVVENAGGTIDFTSGPGEGAQFWFTLPASGLAAMPESQQTPQSTPPAGLSALLFLRNPDVGGAVAHMLDPFGNQVIQARTLAEAIGHACQKSFDVIIAEAGDADMLAAAPGVRAPLLAILLRGNRAPSATDKVLRWPLQADQLYAALEDISRGRAKLCPDASSSCPPAAGSLAAIDAQAFSTLEKSLGLKSLIEILQCYIANAEQLTGALADACDQEKWDEAARLAQDIGGAAGGLGLSAITQAARDLTAATRQKASHQTLRKAARKVLREHSRTCQALIHLYPDVA